MGHVEYHLVAGIDRDHCEDILYPSATLVERGNLSRDGLAMPCSDWSDAGCSTCMGD